MYNTHLGQCCMNHVSKCSSYAQMMHWAILQHWVAVKAKSTGQEDSYSIVWGTCAYHSIVVWDVYHHGTIRLVSCPAYFLRKIGWARDYHQASYCYSQESPIPHMTGTERQLVCLCRCTLHAPISYIHEMKLWTSGPISGSMTCNLQWICLTDLLDAVDCCWHAGHKPTRRFPLD